MSNAMKSGMRGARLFGVGVAVAFALTWATGPAHAQAPITVSVQVSDGNDDAEEDVQGGGISFGSSDLELNSDGGRAQVIGIRFLNVPVPAGAFIVDASVVFTVDEVDSGPTSVRVFAHLIGDAPAITSDTFNISSRVRTANFVDWNDIPPWTSVGEFGSDQTTPNLSAVIQEVVNLPNWAEGNAMMIIIVGNPGGERTAESFNGDQVSAPELVISYLTEAPPQTLSVRVADQNDDAEEHITEGNSMDIGSSDLELGAEGGGGDLQHVGVRFRDLNIPQGSEIISASIQFTVDETDDEATSLRIFGELTGNAAAFEDIIGNISSRPRTAAFVDWNDIPVWDTVGEAGPNQQTPDLASIIQEIVNQSSWLSNNSLVIILEPNPGGERTAESFSNADAAPQLTVTFRPALQQRAVFAPADIVAAEGDPSITVGVGIPPDCNANQTLTFTVDSSDPSVATAPDPVIFDMGAAPSQQLTLTLGSAGTTTLTTTNDGGCGDAMGTLTVIPVQSLDVQVLATTIEISEQTFGTVTGDFGAAGTRDLTAASTGTTYTSDPPGVIHVDAEGLVTGLSAGTADVVATNAGVEGRRSVTVTPFTGLRTIMIRVTTGNDDAEEHLNNNGMDLGSSDLELGEEGAGDFQLVGVRFLGLPIPPGASIESAAIQFTVDSDLDSGPTSLRVFGELNPNPPVFSAAVRNISNRARTVNSVEWNNIPPWQDVALAGPDQRTPDLAAIVQELVNQSEWAQGNSMVFIIEGNPGGERTARSFNGGPPEQATQLIVTFRLEPGFKPSPMIAASVDGTRPVTMTIPAPCNLLEDVTYTVASSDPGVAAAANGAITYATRSGFVQLFDLAINGAGTANLTASAAAGSPGACTDIPTVSVQVFDVQAVDLELESTGMEVGDTQQVRVTGDFGPAGTRNITSASRGTTYSSSDPAVATVDANGVITAVGTGTAEITADNNPTDTETVIVAEQLTKIAFIVGTPNLNEGDLAARNHLASLTFSGDPGQIDANGLPAKLVTMDDEAFDQSAVELGFDLVIVSSTVDAAQVGGKFRCKNVPMLFWEPGLHTDAREGLANAGGTSAGHTDQDGNPLEEHTELFILDNSHPITQGLPSNDFVAVYDEPQIISYASAGNQAVIPGGLSADATSLAEFEFLDESTITIADNGGLRVDGNSGFFARRAFLWLTDDSFDNLNATGLQIVNNALNWTLAGTRATLVPTTVDLFASRIQICPPELAFAGTGQASLRLVGNAQFGCTVDLTDPSLGTTYVSSDPSLATVDANGVVTGVALGNVTITASNGALQGTLDIEVISDDREADPSLLAFYPFNNAADPLAVLDTSGNGNDGVVQGGGANYTGDAGGVSGAPGDRAMRFEGQSGSTVAVPAAANGAFDSVIQSNEVTIALWWFGDPTQPNQSQFWAEPGRQYQAHIPWSDGVVYFDTSGCCGAGTQRINLAADPALTRGRWNHWVFIKDGDYKAIYANGVKFHEGINTEPIDQALTGFWIGSAADGGNTSAGLIDDFILFDKALSDSAGGFGRVAVGEAAELGSGVDQLFNLGGESFLSGCPQGTSEPAPVFANIMGGLGSAADTFISPLGEDVPFTQFGLATDIPLDSITVAGSAYTAGGEAPSIASFVSNGDGTHVVTLDSPVAPGNWLRLDLEAAGANTETAAFSVWLAHQPLDVDQDGSTSIRDATAFGDVFRGSGEPRLIDINGDGTVNVRDATGFGNNWNGIAPATRAWRNTSLPARP